MPKVRVPAGRAVPTGSPPDDEIDLTLTDHPRVEGLLGRVTVTLASTLELRTVLRRLARIGYQATDARHCSVFLVDGRLLRPTVAIGREPDDATWRAFRSMGTVRLNGARWKYLAAGKPIAIPDATTSDLVPESWRERFRPGAVVLVPLMAEGTVCGLLAVDWASPREFTPDELAVLEAIGAAAGVAVRNARLFEEVERRARLQEALTRATAALASPNEPKVIAERLLGAYADLLGARLCAIGIFDAERACVTTVASRGPKALEGPIPLGEIPDHVVTRVWESWERAKVPLEFANEPWINERLGGAEAGAGWYQLTPLVVEGHTRGCVLLGFESARRLDADEHAAIRSLAEVASAAVERSVLTDRQDRRFWRLDALYRVSAALTEGADGNTMVATLNALLMEHGIEVESVAFSDERVARRLGADLMTPGERAAGLARQWDAAGDDHAAIPMYLGRRLYGVMRVRPDHLDTEERSFLEALSRGLAEVAHRDDQRHRIEDAGREHLITMERDRMASDLHDTAGQVFVAVALVARSHIESLGPDDPARPLLERMATLSDSGKFEIDHAARALAFAPATRRGLVPSLRELAKDVERDSGISIGLAVEGQTIRLEAVAERALYRVAHEAVANAWRHAQCTSLVVTISFGDDEIVLAVSDDGVGVPDDFAAGRGVKGMERALSECRGSLAIAVAEPSGTVVTARVPRVER